MFVLYPSVAVDKMSVPLNGVPGRFGVSRHLGTPGHSGMPPSALENLDDDLLGPLAMVATTLHFERDAIGRVRQQTETEAVDDGRQFAARCPAVENFAHSD